MTRTVVRCSTILRCGGTIALTLCAHLLEMTGALPGALYRYRQADRLKTSQPGQRHLNARIRHLDQK